MHVLQLLPSLEVGGVERGVLDLAKGLIARGHRVSVVSSGGPLVERLTALGAMHHTLPVHEKKLSTMASCIPALEQIIRTTGVDLVHARSRIPAWTGWVAARRTGKPFVTTAHGFYRAHPGSAVMTWGKIVIVPSDALAKYLINRFNVPPERIRIIPRGVDLDEFKFHAPTVVRDRPWRIGLIGRVSFIKGHDYALRAFARLQQRGWNVQLVFAGDTGTSALRQQLEDTIFSLRLKESVQWLGVQANIPELIRSLDIVMVPSVYPESFGRGIIEAHAVGRPVVTTAIGAFEELVADRHNGLVVPPRDVDALTEALERLLTYPSLRRRCIVIGRRRTEAEWTVDKMVDRTLAVYEECVTRQRVLVWKLSAVGDVILSVPGLRAIRRHFARGKITLVVGRAAYEIVAHCPYVDDIVIYDGDGKDRGWARNWKFADRLRRIGFDVSVDLQNSKRTHVLARLVGVPVRIGFNRKFGWLLNRAVRIPKVILAPIANQQYLLRESGITTAGESLEVWPTALDERRAEDLLQLRNGGAPAAGAAQPSAQGQPIVGVHPGGSERWKKTKRWEVDHWIKLIDALGQQGIKVAVVGGVEERDLGQEIMRAARHQPLMLIGQSSLMELACIISRCDVFVGHDSSTLHMANAVGTPTVVLFGPTDPRRHLPPAFQGTVLSKEVPCGPCYSTTCRTITHACMNKIEVDEVLASVLSQLSEAEGRGSRAAIQSPSPRQAPIIQ